MVLHGSVVICLGIDVNSRSSAWLGKICAASSWVYNKQSLARDTCQTSDEPNCNKKIQV